MNNEQKKRLKKTIELLTQLEEASYDESVNIVEPHNASIALEQIEYYAEDLKVLVAVARVD